MTLHIAIDGPAGAGKSTVAQRVAKRLSIPYIDTGAMYRCVTWSALVKNISLQDEYLLAELAQSLSIKFVPNDQGQLIYLDGQNVTSAIRTSEIGALVSTIAAYPLVRKTLVVRQRKMVDESSGVVMDGRDIGTYVLPFAEVKVYLTASLETRARRRYEELILKGYTGTYEDVLHVIEQRDESDERRTASPLRKASDALLLDTTTLTIDEVVAIISSLCVTRQSRKRS